MLDEKFYDIIEREINELEKIYSNNEFLQKQNDQGKKSFLFLFWFLKRYLPNKNLSELDNYITEGNDDSSCDLIFDNTDQYNNKIFYVVQAKWFKKSNINKSNQISKEIKACLSDFRVILSGKKHSEHNKNFNLQYEKLIKHKQENGKIKFIFLALCNGKINLSEHIDDFITDLIGFDLIDFHKLKKQYIDLTYKGIKTHNPIETPYLPSANFNLKFEKTQFIKVEKPYKGYIFLIRAKQIYDLFNKYGHALFYKNIRNPLLISKYNKDIKNTILDDPLHFWYFNNGITAITDEISFFHNDSDQVTIKGIQIINGAQTVYSIYEAYKYASDEKRIKIDQNALISLRVVESGGINFDLKVTRFTNSQNPISERDFHSNDKVQDRLQNDFLKNTNIWYERRRGEFRKRVKGIKIISNEILGQYYLSYYINDPFNAKQNKKMIFVSKDVNINGLYETIFNEDTKYDDMLTAYYLYLFIDRERKKIKSKIEKLNTEDLPKDQTILEFDFIQYANFDILALFKILLYKIHQDNIKAINGKIRKNFEQDILDTIQNYYQFIIIFIKEYIKNKKETNPNIVNSVIFKNKEFYKQLKEKFDLYLEESNELKKLK